MRVHLVHPILNVSDVPASILWFEALGWFRGFTWNPEGVIDEAELENEHGPAVFASVCAEAPEGCEGPAIFLCEDGQGGRDPDTPADPERNDYGGVWMSWWVDDVDTYYAACLERGVEVVRPPQDEPWGARELLIRHPDGHYFRVSRNVG